MDHQPTDAGSVDVPAVDPADTTAALRAALAPEIEGESEEKQEAPEGGAPKQDLLEEEAPEIDADDFDDDGEPEGEQETAIDAPASLNAEERESYSQLPQEAQAFVKSLEARRNADVTKVTTKAADAQRVAEAQAAQAVVEAKRNYAEQIDAFTANFAPQMPDPALAQTDPAGYIALKAQYDAQIGHFQQLKDQIEGIGNEANQEAQRAFVESRDKDLMQIPEVANPETRKEYLDRVFDPSFLQSLNYEPQELASIADAEDIKRLNSIREWQEKAAKFDKAMSRKMKRVRQGKPRATKPGIAQQNSSKSQALDQQIAQLKKSGSSDDARAALKTALFK